MWYTKAGWSCMDSRGAKAFDSPQNMWGLAKLPFPLSLVFSRVVPSCLLSILKLFIFLLGWQWHQPQQISWLPAAHRYTLESFLIHLVLWQRNPEVSISACKVPSFIHTSILLIFPSQITNTTQGEKNKYPKDWFNTMSMPYFHLSIKHSSSIGRQFLIIASVPATPFQDNYKR